MMDITLLCEPVNHRKVLFRIIESLDTFTLCTRLRKYCSFRKEMALIVKKEMNEEIGLLHPDGYPVSKVSQGFVNELGYFRK